ncbi:hypothetical protein GQX74_014879 [Glossina fuscipes]|nr:hypothetical protein GQX74_014879 [Glossina fuscipes]
MEKTRKEFTNLFAEENCRSSARVKKSNIRVEFPRFFYGNSHYTANGLFDAHLLSPATLQDGKKVASKLDEVDEYTSICTESGYEKASGGTDMAHDTLSFAFSPTLNRTDWVNAEVMSSSAVPVVHVYPPSDEDLTMNSLRRQECSSQLADGDYRSYNSLNTITKCCLHEQNDNKLDLFSYVLTPYFEIVTKGIVRSLMISVYLRLLGVLAQDCEI